MTHKGRVSLEARSFLCLYLSSHIAEMKDNKAKPLDIKFRIDHIHVWKHWKSTVLIFFNM